MCRSVRSVGQGWDAERFRLAHGPSVSTRPTCKVHGGTLVGTSCVSDMLINHGGIVALLTMHHSIQIGQIIFHVNGHDIVDPRRVFCR